MATVGAALSTALVPLATTAVGFRARLSSVFIVHASKSSRWGLGRVTCMASYKVTLRTPAVIHTLEVDDGVTILDAAEEAAIDMPYSSMCRNGGCPECAGVLELGQVDQSAGNFLDKQQLGKGFCLTCVAYPRSDCTITTHQEDLLIRSIVADSKIDTLFF